MTNNRIEVTPSVTVHELLEAYPELEDVLVGIAPPFKKLKNPFLRKTVAKVATIKHISSVGGVPLNELIAKLRDAVGQPPINETFVDEEYFIEQPEWYSLEKVVTTFLPAPGIDKLKAKGYLAWVKKDDDGLIKSYFLKPAD